MFLVNEIQVADRLNRVREDIDLAQVTGGVDPLWEDAALYTLDRIWSHFFPDQKPDWHYSDPPEDEICDLIMAKF